MKIELYCKECFEFFEVDQEYLEYIDEFCCPECGHVIDLNVTED